MFTCAVCKESIGPRVKPVLVISGTRPQSYHNKYMVEDEWGKQEKREVDSIGTEITGEHLVCPKDALEHYGIVAPEAKVIAPYLRKFEEKVAEPLGNKFVATMVHNALDRTTHETKRADRDLHVSIPLVKFFTDHNKGLIF